jgi:DNA-binding transcriptional MerR regulator
MNRKDKKLYTTGEFAKKFNIKKDTLFYYDKIGLFQPIEVDEKGYRYYSSTQIPILATILALREMNISINKLQEYFIAPAVPKLLDLVDEQVMGIEKEIERLKTIKRRFEAIRENLIEGESVEFEKLYIKDEKRSRYIYSNFIDKELEVSLEEWLEMYNEFMLKLNKIDIISIGSVISNRDLKRKNFGRVCCLFVEDRGQTRECEEIKKYAIYYYKGGVEDIDRVYNNILDEIEKMGYEIVGDAYEEYLITELEGLPENINVVKIRIEIR